MRYSDFPVRSIKHVVLDVDGTLYSRWMLRALVALDFLLFYTVRAGGLTEFRIIVAYRTRWNDCARQEKDFIYHEECSNVASLFNIEKTRVSECIEIWLQERPLRLLQIAKCPFLDSFLSALVSLDKTVSVLSDYPLGKKLKCLGLEDYLVMENGSEWPVKLKPKPDRLLRHIHELSLAPKECMYIGDDQLIDRRAAERAGIRFVHRERFFFFRALMCLKFGKQHR